MLAFLLCEKGFHFATADSVETISLNKSLLLAEVNSYFLSFIPASSPSHIPF
jgi:hypothetical protein